MRKRFLPLFVLLLAGLAASLTPSSIAQTGNPTSNPTSNGPTPTTQNGPAPSTPGQAISGQPVSNQSVSGQVPGAPPASQPFDSSPTTPPPISTQPGAAPAVAPPVPSTSYPSMPAYRQQSAPAPSAPAPTPATAPSIVPAPQTAQAPYIAMPAYAPYGVPDEDKKPNRYGSTYIPVDSWIYPAMTRLYSLGYVDTMFLGLRPWTRQSVLHMLDESEGDITDGDSDEAAGIFQAVKHELRDDEYDGIHERGLIYGTKSVYDRAMVISGTPLRDSFHLGQTLKNDYGRPYANGFNNLLGFSTIAEYGRFSLDLRGEYQHTPGTTGYSQPIVDELQAIDQTSAGLFPTAAPIPATIPRGPIGAQNPFRLVEATVSFHLLGHEISGGKSDAWLGPGQGGSLAWTNNAENIYSFRINRVEPLHIPLVSYLLGPIRYDFFYGSLKGHTTPNDDWVHSEKLSFRPTKNVEIGFQRTVIFGGKGHEPVTLHTFLKGFFDVSDTTTAEKYSRSDPGARFTAFDFSWRLPFLRKYATLYTDSEAHDDVTPPSAPRRAAYRTGIYLSQIPGARKFDLRIEGVSSDPPVTRSMNGSFNYYETIQRDGYTNKGFIMGDWIGREAKGGQAWLTYHLSGNEYVELEYLNKKTPKDFIPGVYNSVANTYGPGGTTQNQFKATVVKRFLHDNVELNAWFQYEGWKAPIYLPGKQNDTTTAVQVTFFPALKHRDKLY